MALQNVIRTAETDAELGSPQRLHMCPGQVRNDAETALTQCRWRRVSTARW